jgi:hypothetical protein
MGGRAVKVSDEDIFVLAAMIQESKKNRGE